MYVNKEENRITFKIKARHYLEPLTIEAMKLLRITKSMKLKMKMVKMSYHLEITEVALVHCNVVNIDYQQNSICFKYIICSIVSYFPKKV